MTPSSPELHWFYMASEDELQELQARPSLAEDHFRQQLKDCVAKTDANRAAPDLTVQQFSDPRVWVVGRGSSGPVIRCMRANGWAVK